MKPDIISTKGYDDQSSFGNQTQTWEVYQVCQSKGAPLIQWATLLQYIQRWEVLKMEAVVAITLAKISFVSGAAGVQSAFLPCCTAWKSLL